MPGMNIKPPKNDDEYFERLTKSVFTAGLSWRMVDKKWPHFHKAFADFSIPKVAKFNERNVKTLMGNTGIVRNEKKIKATIHNAGEFLKLQKEFGSVNEYIGSYGKNEEDLQTNVQERFQHVGPMTARTFLWSSGCPLTPNKEEKKWMASHK
jgi:3-methyladenine DNA glycosylase Tag